MPSQEEFEYCVVDRIKNGSTRKARRQCAAGLYDAARYAVGATYMVIAPSIRCAAAVDSRSPEAAVDGVLPQGAAKRPGPDDWPRRRRRVHRSYAVNRSTARRFRLGGPTMCSLATVRRDHGRAAHDTRDFASSPRSRPDDRAPGGPGRGRWAGGEELLAGAAASLPTDGDQLRTLHRALDRRVQRRITDDLATRPGPRGRELSAPHWLFSDSTSGRALPDPPRAGRFGKRPAWCGHSHPKELRWTCPRKCSSTASTTRPSPAGEGPADWLYVPRAALQA